MGSRNRHRRLDDSLSYHDMHSTYLRQGHAELANSGDRGDRFHLTSNSSPKTFRSMEISSGCSYYQEPSNFFSFFTGINAYLSDVGLDKRQQRQQPQQQQSLLGFSGYSMNGMMFNDEQPIPQTSVYGTQQFRTGGFTEMSLITPDIASGDGGDVDLTNTPASSNLQHPAQGLSSSTAKVCQQQTSSALNYSPSMPQGIGASVQDAIERVEYLSHEEANYSENALKEKWISYQRQLGTAFQNISSGALESTSETLLTISDWLLSQVVDLGLTVDDVILHAGRIKLWNDFNHAWLALGQRQKDIVEASGELLSRATIIKLGNTLVSLCGGLERHGLVDYQYGVWEDEIIAILEDCLDLYDNTADPSR